MLSGQSIYDELIYFYPFNEEGNTLVVDATGNNFAGSLIDVQNTTDRFGNLNSAKQFNGESSFISIPYQSMALAEFPVSIAFWIKLDSVGHVGGVIGTEWIENFYTGCWVNVLPESISMGYGDCGTAGQQSRRSKLTNHYFLNEQWHHVVAVFSDEVNTNTEYISGNYAFEMKMYINGVMTTGDYSGTGGDLCYDSNNFPQWPEEYGGVIGKFDSNTDASSDTIYHFKGKLDNIGYWSRELSESEILDIYQNGLFDECQGLIDECGICDGGGPQIVCWNDFVVCDIDDCPEQTGCMYELACNFNSEATIEDGSCVFPGEICELDNEALGVYNSYCECVENNTSVQESYDYKTIIRTVDVLGREKTNNKGFQLHIYDDGSVEKKYVIK